MVIFLCIGCICGRRALIFGVVLPVYVGGGGWFWQERVNMVWGFRVGV